MRAATRLFSEKMNEQWECEDEDVYREIIYTSFKSLNGPTLSSQRNPFSPHDQWRRLHFITCWWWWARGCWCQWPSWWATPSPHYLKARSPMCRRWGGKTCLSIDDNNALGIGSCEKPELRAEDWGLGMNVSFCPRQFQVWARLGIGGHGAKQSQVRGFKRDK